MAEKTDWVSADEAAAILGTTRLNVLMCIKRGVLRGEPEDGGWRVDSQSLEEYRALAQEDRPEVVCKKSCPKSAGCSGCH